MNQKLLEQQFVGCVNNAEVVIAGFAEALGNLRFSRKPAWFKFVQQNTNWVANATVYAVVRNVSERATTEVHAVIADLAFAIQRDWQVDRNDALTWAWNIAMQLTTKLPSSLRWQQNSMASQSSALPSRQTKHESKNLI